MSAYVFVNAEGYPVEAGEHPTFIPEGAIPLASEKIGQLARLRWLDESWMIRPTLPGPEVTEGNLWFDGLPDGAVVTISDAITGVLIATPSTWVGGVEIDLPKGSYQVHITAPNPWLDYEGMFEVDGGDPQREIDAEHVALNTRRANMKCSRLQGRLVLGPVICGQIDAMAKGLTPSPFAPDSLEDWALRETIQNAIEWSRTSESMDMLGYLMGFTAEQMDALFEAAMQVKV